jgi:chemotaxis protein methyltransferase CheR
MVNSSWENRFGTKKLLLSEPEFTILRDLIHERLGSFYQNNKRELLEDKLSSLVIERGFDSFLDYYYLLKYDSVEAENEWIQVMNALRVPETFFWREIDQIHALVKVLVPDYFASKPQEPLRIWSAACSSGEEPLTIAMALHEAGWLERAPIEIIASDISKSAITRACQGRYRHYSLRNLPAEFRDKYFQAEQDKWRIMPELVAKIKWHTANLIVRTEIAPFASASIIFCRNIFIYFSEEMIRKTVRTFFELMPTRAYLFVGASESLLKVTTDFDLQEIGGAFVYVKSKTKIKNPTTYF